MRDVFPYIDIKSLKDKKSAKGTRKRRCVLCLSKFGSSFGFLFNISCFFSLLCEKTIYCIHQISLYRILNLILFLEKSSYISQLGMLNYLKTLMFPSFEY